MPPEAGSLRRQLPVLALAAFGVAFLGLFLYLRGAADPAPVDGTDLTAERLDETYHELCRVRALAETGVEDAETLFFGQVHSPLHVIAAAAGEQDRAAAARMLEAKNDVETAFNTGASPAGVASRLDRLLSSTAEALRSIGVSPSTCEI